jgi:large subunit ribosomal protein L10
MLKEEKERVVAEIVERLRTSETLLVADYRGLTHAELDRVRTDLLKLGARFTVVKNTLTRRAAGVDTLEEFLTGPTAIAFVTEGDAVGVAKVLADTARETRRLTLKGGVMHGRVVDGEAVRELATLPPEDVLRGQLLGMIVGPVSSIVGIFAAPLRDLVGVLDARIRQLGEQGGADADAPAAADDEPAPVEDQSESAAEAEAPTEEGQESAEPDSSAEEQPSTQDVPAEETVSEEAAAPEEESVPAEGAASIEQPAATEADPAVDTEPEPNNEPETQEEES